MAEKTPRQALLEALRRLSWRRPLFHSVADFRHELALELKETGFTEIRLDWPFLAEELKKTQERLSILAEYGEVRVGFEARYQSAIINQKERWGFTTCKGTSETYAPEPPKDPKAGLALFEADLRRLSDLIERRVCCFHEINQGFVLLLSNEQSLWQGQEDQGPKAPYPTEWIDYSQLDRVPEEKGGRFRLLLTEINSLEEEED